MALGARTGRRREMPGTRRQAYDQGATTTQMRWSHVTAAHGCLVRTGQGPLRSRCREPTRGSVEGTSGGPSPGGCSRGYSLPGYPTRTRVGSALTHDDHPSALGTGPVVARWHPTTPPQTWGAKWRGRVSQGYGAPALSASVGSGAHRTDRHSDGDPGRLPVEVVKEEEESVSEIAQLQSEISALREDVAAVVVAAPSGRDSGR